MMRRGIPSWHEAALVPIFRNGAIEDSTGRTAIRRSSTRRWCMAVAAPVKRVSAVGATLTQPGHHGKTYVVTGSEAMSYRQAAEIIGTVIGKKLRFVDETPEEHGLAAFEKAFRLPSSKAFSLLVPINVQAAKPSRSPTPSLSSRAVRREPSPISSRARIGLSRLTWLNDLARGVPRRSCLVRTAAWPCTAGFLDDLGSGRANRAERLNLAPFGSHARSRQHLPVAIRSTAFRRGCTRALNGSVR